jgi:hypothetical protein
VWIITGEVEVVRGVMLVVSITALRANEDPVSRWHPEGLADREQKEKEREINTATMAAVHYEGFGFHPVLNVLAIATSF